MVEMSMECLLQRGVYVIQCQSEIIYVGMTTVAFVARLGSHFTQLTEVGEYLRKCAKNKVTLSVTFHPCEPDAAFKLERELIESLNPALNGKPRLIQTGVTRARRRIAGDVKKLRERYAPAESRIRSYTTLKERGLI